MAGGDFGGLDVRLRGARGRGGEIDGEDAQARLRYRVAKEKQFARLGVEGARDIGGGVRAGRKGRRGRRFVAFVQRLLPF